MKRAVAKLLAIALSIARIALVSDKAFCKIRRPHALSDDAVLQRDVPIHIWGWATAGMVRQREWARAILFAGSGQIERDSDVGVERSERLVF